MIKKNLNIFKGGINGTVAIVTSFIFDDNEIITSIIIKVVSTYASSILSNWTLHHKYTYEAYFYKTSFPIVLTYVITGHKTQGATITSKVFIDLRESFVPGFRYVMLSRVINHANLWFVVIWNHLILNALNVHRFFEFFISFFRYKSFIYNMNNIFGMDSTCFNIELRGKNSTWNQREKHQIQMYKYRKDYDFSFFNLYFFRFEHSMKSYLKS